MAGKKETRSAKELSAIIADRLGLQRINVSVAKDPAYGWHPTVFATPLKCTGPPNRRGKYSPRTARAI
jgi:hypothetical protein